MVAINLITLWVDSRHDRRILLLSLNMVLHFFAIHHMFWALPHNGDTTPDIRKSQFCFQKKTTSSKKIVFLKKIHTYSTHLAISYVLIVRRKDINLIEHKIYVIARAVRVKRGFIHSFIYSFTSFHIANIKIVQIVDNDDDETKMNVSFTQDKRIRLTKERQKKRQQMNMKRQTENVTCNIRFECHSLYTQRHEYTSVQTNTHVFTVYVRCVCVFIVLCIASAYSKHCV